MVGKLEYLYVVYVVNVDVNVGDICVVRIVESSVNLLGGVFV